MFLLSRTCLMANGLRALMMICLKLQAWRLGKVSYMAGQPAKEKRHCSVCTADLGKAANKKKKHPLRTPSRNTLYEHPLRTLSTKEKGCFLEAAKVLLRVSSANQITSSRRCGSSKNTFCEAPLPKQKIKF